MIELFFYDHMKFPFSKRPQILIKSQHQLVGYYLGTSIIDVQCFLEIFELPTYPFQP